MKVYDQVDVIIEAEPETLVQSLKGKRKPHAYILDYGDNGYAKFQYDQQTLDVFAKSISKIESSLTRKQIYAVMFDMVKEGLLAGQQYLEILKEHIPQETA